MYNCTCVYNSVLSKFYFFFASQHIHDILPQRSSRVTLVWPYLCHSFFLTTAVPDDEITSLLKHHIHHEERMSSQPGMALPLRFLPLQTTPNQTQHESYHVEDNDITRLTSLIL